MWGGEFFDALAPVDVFGFMDDFIALDSAEGDGNGLYDSGRDEGEEVDGAEGGVDPREEKKQDNGAVRDGARENFKKTVFLGALPLRDFEAGGFRLVRHDIFSGDFS